MHSSTDLASCSQARTLLRSNPVYIGKLMTRMVLQGKIRRLRLVNNELKFSINKKVKSEYSTQHLNHAYKKISMLFRIMGFNFVVISYSYNRN